ncbi:hypothetical protein QQS21_010786 [Conoideocrella luteorostrata]|uniref:Uncharacterized protein n=1 Tax=Conoideocrella luteorostrata TaxID=1105319 RepID=A0AAJ0CEH7_9HYPO|nr:hypothetical protein QQS21_010786 [Conoideocrella luteorostrata]
MKVLTSLRSSLKNANVTENGRVPNEIRRCVELVQTCHRDLQHLIDLRNEHLKFLETKPRYILTRINSVIEDANQGLVDARCIVEKCRPKAHRGMKTPLHSQIEWTLGLSAEFRSQEPVISLHNQSVLAELGYLRQMTMWTLLDSNAMRGDPATLVNGDQRTIETIGWIDMADAGEKGTGKVPASIPDTPALLTPDPGFATSRDPIKYSDLPEAVFPNLIPGSASGTETPPLPYRPLSSAGATTTRENASSYSVVLRSDDIHGFSILFEDGL